MRSRILSIALILAAAAPVLVWAATNSDGTFRSCMQQVTNNRENRIFDAVNGFQTVTRDILVERRQRYFDAWGIENDRDRSSVLRDIDSNIRTRLRDVERVHKQDLRTIQNDYRNDERRCKDELRQRERDRKNVPVGRTCRVTDECSPPAGACTTEFGECILVCDAQTQSGSITICTHQVCTGRCVIR